MLEACYQNNIFDCTVQLARGCTLKGSYLPPTPLPSYVDCVNNNNQTDVITSFFPRDESSENNHVDRMVEIHRPTILYLPPLRTRPLLRRLSMTMTLGTNVPRLSRIVQSVDELWEARGWRLLSRLTRDVNIFCNLEKLHLRMELVSDCPTNITDGGVARFEQGLRIAKDANIVVRAGAIQFEPEYIDWGLREFIRAAVLFEETSRVAE